MSDADIVLCVWFVLMVAQGVFLWWVTGLPPKKEDTNAQSE